MSRERRCGHHAAETPLHACTAVRVPKYHSVRDVKYWYISPFVEMQFTRNPAIDVAADCLAAPRRNFEADSPAPWQRPLPLDHVQVAAVRVVWHES